MSRAGRTPARGVWSRSGEMWVVGLGAQRTPLRDSKGMRHLRILLERPGEEVSALKLVAVVEGHGGPAASVAGEGLATAGVGHAGEMLDPRAKAEYRARLGELQQEIEEADRFNDPERSARAHEELEFLTRELASAVGLGGRDRRSGADSERARVNVTRAIKMVLERVGEHDEELAAHLRASVKTGTHCVYAPATVDPVDWDFEDGGVAGEPAAAGAATEPPTSRARRPPRSRVALVERDQELARIDGALTMAAQGCGGMVIVAGPAGIGKSALLDAAEDRAAELGFGVLRARGSELEQAFTFGIARQLFDPPLAQLKPGQRSALLGGAVRPAAAMLGYVEHDDGVDASGTAGFHVLNGLHWLTVALAQAEPVLVIVDDVHWADAETISWLTFMTPRLGELNVVFAVATRPLLDASVDAAFAELLDSRRHTVLELAPLSEQAVGEIVRRSCPEASADFRRACHAASAGNPFYLHELLASARAAGIAPDEAGARRLPAITPESVSRTVNARLRLLPGAAATLAQACAVLGGPVASDLAAEVAGVPFDAAFAAVDDLTGAGILEAEPELDYAHPIIRGAIASKLPLGLRTTLHERAAVALSARGAPPHEVAVHLLHARPAGNAGAVERLRGAARHSAQHGAPETSVRLLERALAEPPDDGVLPEVLLELAHAKEDCGDEGGAVTALERALPLAADPALHATLVLSLTRQETVELPERVAMLDAEIERVGDVDRELRFDLEAQAVELLGRAVIISASPDAGARYEERLARAATMADGGTTSERHLLAIYASQNAIRGRIRASEAKDLAVRALDNGVLMSRLAEGDEACDAALEVLTIVDAYDLADRHAREAERRARERGVVAAEAYACMLRAVIAFNRGALPETEALLRSVFAISDQTGHGYVEYVAHLMRAGVCIEHGDFEEAERAAAAATDVGYIPIGGPHVRGLLHAARGEHEMAVAELTAAYELQREAGRWRSLALGAVGPELAISLAAVGRRDEAVALAREQLEVPRRFGSPRAIALALRALGMTLGGEEGLEALREAAAVIAGSQAMLTRGHVLHQLGVATLAAGDADGARTHLRQALELARRCGARRLAEQAAQRLGEGADAVGGGDSELLTPGERRVAELAAEGVPDLQIAQALMMSVPAVAEQLAAVYRKLAVASPEEFAARIRDAA